MTYLLSILILTGCFLLLGIGFLVARKTLQRGCSLGPECTCKNNPAASSEDCEHRIK